MGKSKVSSAKPAKADKALTSVKGGAVTKSSKSDKAKSSKMAKETAKKADLKKVKQPESSDEDSESSASSASDSDDEMEVESKKPVKANGKAKVPAKKDESDSSDDSDDSDASDESDDEKPASKVQKNGKAQASSTTKKASARAQSSDEDEDSDSDSDSDEEKKPSNKAAAKEAGSDDSDSDSGSDDSSDDDDEDEKMEEKEKEVEEEKPKKRKAEEAAPADYKKQRKEGESEPSKNLFVGSLSWNVDDEWLNREFSQYGEISGARVVTDRNTGRSKGFGYVEFANLDDAIAAHSGMTGAQIDGRVVNIDFSQPRQDGGSGGQRQQQRARTYGDQVSEPSSVLFVGNIAFGADESMLSEAFSEHGDVRNVRLPTDPDTGNLKGFGYVEFGSVNDAMAAFDAMSGASIAGRPIRLDYSQPRQNNGGGGGRGRGGGGFGGRGDRGGGRGGFGGRGRGGAPRGGRGGSTNRGGFGDFRGQKVTF